MRESVRERNARRARHAKQSERHLNKTNEHHDSHLGQSGSGRHSKRDAKRTAKTMARIPNHFASPRGISLAAVGERITSSPLLVPVVGLVVLILLVSRLISCATGTFATTNAYNGSGGIHNTALYEKKSKLFYADLMVPRVFVPARPIKATITGTSRDSGTAGDQLSAAVKAIESNGYQVGFVLKDLNTSITVSYNADSSFYTASSLKGPYVVSLVEYNLGDSYLNEDKRIADILQYSDNEAYATLRSIYGSDCFATLADAAGATSMSTTGATDAISWAAESQSVASITDNNYEFISPNQMEALWEECYDFLSSDNEGATWLAELFENPEISPIRSTAQSMGTTWSKAGWYPAESEAYATTVDAGIVHTNTGDVVLCVMTNDPEDFATVESIVSPLLAMRATLTN